MTHTNEFTHAPRVTPAAAAALPTDPEAHYAMFRFIQLHTSSLSPRIEAIAAARSALDLAGACVTAINHFAEKASVLNFEVPPAQIQDIVVELRRSGMVVEEDSLPALDLWVVDRHGDAAGTLQILFLGNESQRVDQVPAVPG